MSPDGGRLPLAHAVALGLLHGPAEQLPVSSSAHTALVPRLLGWEHGALPGDVRKAFEVALHAGSLAGLLLTTPLPPARTALVATAIPAAAGLAFESPIEQRLGGPRATALGLLAGSAVLLAADARPRVGGQRAAFRATTSRKAARRRRTAPSAVAIGVAQALALVPGLSRLGLTVAVGRRAGLDRPGAFELGRSVGLPVLAGATVLKGARVVQRGLPRELRLPFAAGAGAAFASTLASAPLARRTPVRVAAAERALLAVAVLWDTARR